MAPTPALLRMLDEVASWRDRVGLEADEALTAIAAEERAARRDLEEAQRRHGALLAIRREEEERLGTLEEEALRRKRASVRNALLEDRSLLEDRAAALGELQARREADLSARLDDPDMAPFVEEYLEAQAAAGGAQESELLLSPETATRLAPFIVAAHAPPEPLTAPPVGVGVLVSADPPVGSPEALVMVLPVPWAVYAEGTLRAEDLCTWLAYRLVGSLYQLLTDLGAAHAPVRFSDLQGNLAVQVWLGDHPLEEDLRERVLEGIAAAVDGAAELEAAGVEVYAVWLTPDLLAEAVA